MFCAEMERGCGIQKYRAQLPWEELGLKWAFGWSWGRWEGERESPFSIHELSVILSFYSKLLSLFHLFIPALDHFPTNPMPFPIHPLCPALFCLPFLIFTFHILHSAAQYATVRHFSIQTARRNRNKQIRMSSVCLNILHLQFEFRNSTTILSLSGLIPCEVHQFQHQGCIFNECSF